MSTEACKRRGKIFGGCHFEARYDVSEPIIPPTLKHADRFYPEEWARKTYLGDVCTTCGRFVPSPRAERVASSETQRKTEGVSHG